MHNTEVTEASDVSEFRQSQPLMVVHDEVIRRFIRGFFPQNVVICGEEVCTIDLTFSQWLLKYRVS